MNTTNIEKLDELAISLASEIMGLLSHKNINASTYDYYQKQIYEIILARLTKAL